MKDRSKSCSKQKIKKDLQCFIMKKTGHRKPLKTTLQSQTEENANQLTWKQERKLLNRLLGREQVWLRCGPKQQGNGLGSLSQTQSWRCWCLPACCCGPHLQCLRCSPHVGSKLAHEFCSSGVELLPVRKTGDKKGGSILWTVLVYLVSSSQAVSSGFFPRPVSLPVIFLWYLPSRGGGAVRVCVCPLCSI